MPLDPDEFHRLRAGAHPTSDPIEVTDELRDVKAERDRLRAAFEGVKALLDERTDRWAHAIAERDAAEAERDRLRGALEMIATPPVHVPGVSEGCEGCAGVARAALDGRDIDTATPLSVTLDQVDAEAERDRLRGVVDELKRAAEGPASEDPSDEPYVEGNSSAWAYVLKVIEEGT